MLGNPVHAATGLTTDEQDAAKPAWVPQLKMERDFEHDVEETPGVFDQPDETTLLVELLTEELPPKALARLGTSFAEGIVQRLAARDLIAGEPSFEKEATPAPAGRRDQERAQCRAGTAGPRESAAGVRRAGQGRPAQPRPSPRNSPALGFPDFPVSDLERAQDGKAEAFFLRYAAPGATLAEGPAGRAR